MLPLFNVNRSLQKVLTYRELPSISDAAPRGIVNRFHQHQPPGRTLIVALAVPTPSTSAHKAQSTQLHREVRITLSTAYSVLSSPVHSEHTYRNYLPELPFCSETLQVVPGWDLSAPTERRLLKGKDSQPYQA